MKIFLTIILFASVAFPCGASQPIYGRVLRNHNGLTLTMQATVTLRTLEGDLIETTRSNPFGYYQFNDVSPCGNYSVRAYHKWYLFLPEPVLSWEFEGKGVRKDLWVNAPE
jgi:hypothetical protein